MFRPKIASQILIFVVLILGIFFRFSNLDQKIYWYDEAFTSLRISGYTEREVATEVFNGHVIKASDLEKFQRLNSEKGIAETVKGLALEEPQLPPLYFILVRFWAQLFGDSIASVRSLSAVISLMILPCLYGLCKELFKESFPGWLAVTLTSISPYFVLFAQDARMYSLWAVMTLFSSILLLRAMRFGTKMSWFLYAISLSLGFYTHLLTLLNAVGYGLYVIIMERYRLTCSVVKFAISSIVALVLFSPWILVLFSGVRQAEKMTNASSVKRDVFRLLSAWVFQPTRIFLDLNITRDSSTGSILLAGCFALLLFGLISYSVIYLCQRAPKSAAIFIIILILIGPVTLALRGRSTTMRYLGPSYLGLQIAAAYCLSHKVSLPKFGGSIIGKQYIWKGVSITLIACGIISCTTSYSALYWWNKGVFQNLEAAQVINQANRPLVIASGVVNADGSMVGNVLSLSHLLEPDVKLTLTIAPDIPTVPEYKGDLFLYNTPYLIPQIEDRFQVKPVGKRREVRLWKLIPL